ncbi:polyphosphate kinase 1 [Comamonas jiangduensis]|uniref:polyphosphate kinase 1 n=1 Tax=Comamonas jiangduensis TaxID=1194168 RepID=UPI0024E127B5|nr:polyphosphate kinase 1 [Comamonas jiangduensis]
MYPKTEPFIATPPAFRALPQDAVPVPEQVALTAAQTSTAPLTLLPRDHCILAFNERVMAWARREDVPLLERLRYLCIVSSNLDEFFEVRSAPHIVAVNAQTQGVYNMADGLSLLRKAQELVARQYALYNDALVPAFASAGIRIVHHQARTAAQRRWVYRHFQKAVKPLLVPVALDPAHPFPQVANKSLNMVVRLKGGDAFGRANEVAIVKLSRALPRLMEMPASICGKQRLFVSLSSMVRAHISELFDGREVIETVQFRVTRNTELLVEEDEVDDLRTALREELAYRQFGQAVRLEVSSHCSEFLATTLLQEFDLPRQALFRVHGPVNLVRLAELIDLVNEPSMLFKPWQGSWPRQLKPAVKVMAQMRKQDVLIHQPFEQFDAVLELLREAVHDPAVVAIKQTIYRTGVKSELMDLLAKAVRLGKEVMAVVELKARFDEEANINWADALEAVGAQVVYGVVGLKTHGKMLLVTRREGRGLRRYGHLSTGNYNPKTARMYTDLSYLTCDPVMTADMDAVFRHLASPNVKPKLDKLVMAPFALQQTMLAHLQSCKQAALEGQYARVVVKSNAMTDEVLMHALVEAGQAGVRIDLIVRGACMLPPQVPGLTDNIRVRSIIGRLLEHSRVFYFAWGEEQEHVYLSSADWMRRNMTRRVELAWPVQEPKLRQRVIDECLVAYLHDDRDAWTQQPDGSYLPAAHPHDGHGAQNALMQLYGAPA